MASALLFGEVLLMLKKDLNISLSILKIRVEFEIIFSIKCEGH